MRLLPFLPLAVGLMCGCNREPASPHPPTPTDPMTQEEFMARFSTAWNNRDSALFSDLLKTSFILEFPEQD